MLEVLGLLAGVLTTVAWLPQLMQTLRTRSADGLSWPYLVLGSGLALWVAYGVLARSTAAAVANLVTILLVGGIVTVKARFAWPAHS